MNGWIHSLLQELEDKLTYMQGTDALQACREANAKLSGYMSQHVFMTRSEEILYFKTFKPRFMAYQLFHEILVSGENPEPGAIAPWLREYYENGSSRADGFHFTRRSYRKCDFELPVQACSPAGWETADKQVARILVEKWLEQWLARRYQLTNTTIQHAY